MKEDENINLLIINVSKFDAGKERSNREYNQ
jgi:hypothetical protein